MKKYIVTKSFTVAKKGEILTTNDLDDFERLYNSKGKWVCDLHSIYGEAYCKPYEEQNYPTRNYNIDIEPFTYTHVYKENGNITDVISYTSQKELVKVFINKGVTVQAGSEVDAGTVIGAIGDTAEIESADAPHLHFEVLRNGQYIEPIEFIGIGTN